MDALNRDISRLWNRALWPTKEVNMFETQSNKSKFACFSNSHQSIGHLFLYACNGISLKVLIYLRFLTMLRTLLQVSGCKKNVKILQDHGLVCDLWKKTNIYLLFTLTICCYCELMQCKSSAKLSLLLVIYLYPNLVAQNCISYELICGVFWSEATIYFLG